MGEKALYMFLMALVWANTVFVAVLLIHRYRH